jgi:hypothetical protein
MDKSRRPRKCNDRVVKRLAASGREFFLGAKTTADSYAEARHAIVATTRDPDMGGLSTDEAFLGIS